MFRNYLKTALRHILRNRVSAFINIAGLSIGICACILIFLYVRHELSYDKHHTGYDRIYRINTKFAVGTKTDYFAYSSYALTSNLRQMAGQNAEYTQLMPIGKQTIWLDDKPPRNEENIFYTDTVFFKIFKYRFLQGNPATALSQPHNIVISKDMAERYFGNVSPLGRQLKFTKNSFTVTGVFTDDDKASHIKANAFLSMQTMDTTLIHQINFDWFRMSIMTYFKLKDNYTLSNINSSLDQIMKQFIKPFIQDNHLNSSIKYIIEPITDIHFDNEVTYDLPNKGSRAYVYIFSLVAIFILLIACINYMNMATAKASKRAREVGVRKVLGANRRQLIIQFLSESMLLTIIALAFALVLAELLLPFFNQLTEMNVKLYELADTRVILAMLGMVLLTGLVGGSYPAFFLSSFQPAMVLKSQRIPGGMSSILRKGLVVFQFSISTILIIGTIVVYSQMQYMKHKDMGFNKDNVVVIEVPPLIGQQASNIKVLKDEIMRSGFVKQASVASGVPGTQTGKVLFFLEKNGKHEESTANFMFVGYDYLQMMQIGLLRGRNFSEAIKSDDTAAFIINEAAAKYMEMKEPLGQEMENGLGYKGKVIGVIKDFNFRSLHEPIAPLVLMLNPRKGGSNLLARLDPGHINEGIAFIKKTYQAFDPKHPLEYFFIDETFDKLYRKEEKMLIIFGYFTLLTIFIASLGLFGLSAHMAEQRTKEIGIRKVNGASEKDIVMLFVKEFMKLTALSLIIAWPLSYWLMNNWLQNFAYHINIQIYVFLLAGLLSAFITIITIAYQGIQAALMQPIKTLRYE